MRIPSRPVVLLLLTRLLLWYPQTVAAQNLVINGDFEKYNNCPSGANNGPDYTPDYKRFTTVQDWASAVPTCDYYNADCNSIFSVPGNWLGYQPPHSGKAYAGFFSYYLWNTGSQLLPSRENITTRLAMPLERDTIYEVRFFVSPTFRPENGQTYGQPVSVHEIGANLSDSMPRFGQTYNLDIAYHILNDTSRRLDDTSRWYEIAGKYKAKGGERWLTIGNFRRGSAVPAVSYLAQPTAEPGLAAYLYLDDVSVTKLPPVRQTHYLSICGESGSVLLVSPRDVGAYRWNTRQVTRVISVSKPGTYNCVVTTDTSTYEDIFIIDKVANLPPQIADTAICKDVPSPLLGGTDTALIWYLNAGDLFGTKEQPEIATAAPGRVTLYVARRESHCVSERVAVQVQIREAPRQLPSFAVERCLEIAANEVSIGVPGLDYSLYRWSTGDTICCISTRRDGIYVRLSTNLCGSVTDTFTVKPVACNPCVLLPDAFTPNGDGRNDLFKALLRCPLKEYSIRIFNRWGECVYVSARMDAGWDGTQAGSPAAAGTYMYVVRCMHEANGQEFLVKGDVTLIR